MREVRFVLVGLVLLLVASNCVSAVGKVTTDPNAGGEVAANSAADRADKRLARKVTCEDGYTRLHTVVDHLSAMTGVAIYCGENDRDWRVRDIPVFVRVKDLQLGTVLGALAACTHVRLRASKIGGDTDLTACSYRLLRDGKQKAAIAGYIEDRKAARVAAALWDWDASARYKGVPEPELKGAMQQYRGIGPAISEIVAALGPKVRDRLFAGEIIRIDGSDPSRDFSGMIERLARASQQSLAKVLAESSPHSKLAEVDWRKVYLVLRYDDQYVPGFRIDIQTGNMSSGHTVGSVPGISDKANRELGLPDRPREPKVPVISEMPAEWRRLSFYARGFEMPPSLQVELNLKPPKDLEHPAASDLFDALAKASGFSFICEDFQSHRKTGCTSQKFVPDTTFDEVLKHMIFTFYLDEKNKLIAGTSGSEWLNRHNNLLPESFLTSLGRKLDGPGLDLDDMLEVRALPHEQMGEWIWQSRELDVSAFHMGGGMDQFWDLYHMLSAQDKALAQSADGLPLAKIDPATLAKALTSYNKQVNGSRVLYGDQESRKPVPTDADVLSGMIMSVRKSDHGSYSWVSKETGSAAPKTDPNRQWSHETYKMTLLSKDADGQEVRFDNPAPWTFPIYSAKRLKELAAQK